MRCCAIKTVGEYTIYGEMDHLSKMNVRELSGWLNEQSIPADVIERFEGKFILCSTFIVQPL